MERLSAMEEASMGRGDVMGQRFRPLPSEEIPEFGNLVLSSLERGEAMSIFMDALHPDAIDNMQFIAEDKGRPEWVIETLDFAVDFAEDNDLFREDVMLTDVFPRCRDAGTINEVRVCLIEQGPTEVVDVRGVQQSRPILEVVANAAGTVAVDVLKGRMDLARGMEF